MKSALSLLLFLLYFNSFAQQSAITNAALYHKEGKLDKAVEEINLAVKHDKTSGEAKAWYWRGLIYQTLIDTKEPAYKALEQDPHKAAFESYRKAMSLDADKGEYYTLSRQNMDNLYAQYVNKGVGEYETGAYEKSLESFQNSQKINSQDAKGFLYACFAAEELDRWDLIRTFLNELDRLAYKDAQTYMYKIQLENRDGNTDKALETCNQALAEFPGEENLIKEQTNIYIKQEKRTEAIQNLNILIALDAENVEYLSLLGMQYDASGSKDQALQYYEKTLARDPSHFLANYNSAIIYYEKAKALNEEVHKMPMNQYHTEGKQKEAEEEAHFSKALDHANKALALTSDETDKKNINLLISEIKKVQKDEQTYKSLHKD